MPRISAACRHWSQALLKRRKWTTKATRSPSATAAHVSARPGESKAKSTSSANHVRGDGSGPASSADPAGSADHVGGDGLGPASSAGVGGGDGLGSVGSSDHVGGLGHQPAGSAEQLGGLGRAGFGGDPELGVASLGKQADDTGFSIIAEALAEAQTAWGDNRKNQVYTPMGAETLAVDSETDDMQQEDRHEEFNSPHTDLEAVQSRAALCRHSALEVGPGK